MRGPIAQGDDFMADLSADPVSIRAALNQARAEVEELKVQGAGARPRFEPRHAGAGFSDRGQALVSSLNKVHEAMLQRLDNRLVHFDALDSLAAEIVQGDESNAEVLQHHELG